MKQTAVEWLAEKLRFEFEFAFSNNILEQAKEIEKQQKDEFAIEFAEWIFENEFTYLKMEDIKPLFQFYKRKNKL